MRTKMLMIRTFVNDRNVMTHDALSEVPLLVPTRTIPGFPTHRRVRRSQKSFLLKFFLTETDEAYVALLHRTVLYYSIIYCL